MPVDYNLDCLEIRGFCGLQSFDRAVLGYTVILPDVLDIGMYAVFCGTAAGNMSAATSAYYAHPANRFWPTLHETGLTDVLIRPANYSLIRQYRLGLIDLGKSVSGSDDSHGRDDYDVTGFRAKIRDYAPIIVAFDGKKAAQLALGQPHVDFGLQKQGEEGDDRSQVTDSGPFVAEFPVGHGLLGHAEAGGEITLKQAEVEPVLPEVLPDRFRVAGVTSWQRTDSRATKSEREKGNAEVGIRRRDEPMQNCRWTLCAARGICATRGPGLLSTHRTPATMPFDEQSRAMSSQTSSKRSDAAYVTPL